MATLNVRCSSCDGLNRVQADRLSQAKCGRCKNGLSPSHPLDVDDAGFDALVAAANVPVLVDLWSPTCGPCLMVAPDVAQLAQQQQGNLIVVKIDVSKHQGVANRLGVRGVPTFGVFLNGEQQRLQAGAMPLPQLQSFVAPYVTA